MNNQDQDQDLPLALQIGASAFHPDHNQAKLDAMLAELSPYRTSSDILTMFHACLPAHSSCAVEVVLWAVRAAVAGAVMHAETRAALVDFIDQLAREVDAMHGGGK